MCAPSWTADGRLVVHAFTRDADRAIAEEAWLVTDRQGGGLVVPTGEIELAPGPEAQSRYPWGPGRTWNAQDPFPDESP